MKEEQIEQIKWYILSALTHPIGQAELIFLYYQIGTYLCTNEISYRALRILEIKLYESFGIVIGFTRRNLVSMMRFSRIYPSSELDILKELSWNQHLYLLKMKDLKAQRRLLRNWVGYAQTGKKNWKTENYVFPNDYMVEELKQLQQKLGCI